MIMKIGIIVSLVFDLFSPTLIIRSTDGCLASGSIKQCNITMAHLHVCCDRCHQAIIRH